LGSVAADIAISNMEIRQNTDFIKQKQAILTNDAWTVFVSLKMLRDIQNFYLSFCPF
jgi:hypothetical protein